MTSKIFCAIDTTDLEQAQNWISSITPHIHGIKLGMEFFYTHGKAGVEKALSKADQNTEIFLDLKLHDIPNTVVGALRAVQDLSPKFITLHAAGGRKMIEAASEYASQHLPNTQLLAVTILTHLAEEDMQDIGYQNAVTDQVLKLGHLAKESGAHGLVCSPKEIGALRKTLGDDLTLMVPGIRPASTSVQKDDQTRVMTPKEALETGASHLVIGRPITQADNPADAASQIVKEITPCIAAA